MPNPFVQLAGALSVICGFIVANFLLALYVGVKRMGGNLERRHVFVIGGVAFLFILVGAVLSYVGSITA